MDADRTGWPFRFTREERHLAARFKADYQAYRQTVRRWF